MLLATALAWVGAGLLLVAGLAKLRDPRAARTALALAGVPRGDGLVRALGAGEVVLGAAVLMVGGPLVAAQGLLYVGFTVFVVRQLRHPAASCGCFGGDEDVPLTAAHAAVDAAIAVASAVAAAGSPSALAALDRPTGWVVVPLLVVAVAVVRLLLVDLPTLLAEVRRVEVGT